MNKKNKKSVFGTAEWAEKTVNFINGCEHGCLYCYANEMAIRFKRKTTSNWKEEVANLKTYEAKPPKAKKGFVMYPSTHDLTPNNMLYTVKYLGKLLDAGNQVLIVTKPHIEVIQLICKNYEDYRDKILFRFTIGSINSETLKFWEPNATDYEERKACLIYAFEHGFKTSISCEPMLDDFAISLVAELQPYVTDKIWLGKMNYLKRRLTKNGFYEDENIIRKAN
ncbi:MAG: radical SAM protein [Bacteroidota bacterium]